jgi:hypothetical protein
LLGSSFAYFLLLLCMTIRPAYWLECGHAWNADLTKPNENWIGKTALCPVCAVVSPVKEKVVNSR